MEEAEERWRRRRKMEEEEERWRRRRRDGGGGGEMVEEEEDGGGGGERRERRWWRGGERGAEGWWWRRREWERRRRWMEEEEVYDGERRRDGRMDEEDERRRNCLWRTWMAGSDGERLLDACLLPFATGGGLRDRRTVIWTAVMAPWRRPGGCERHRGGWCCEGERGDDGGRWRKMEEEDYNGGLKWKEFRMNRESTRKRVAWIQTPLWETSVPPQHLITPYLMIFHREAV